MLELGKDCSGTEEGQIAAGGVFVRGGVPGVDSTTTEGMGDEAKQQTARGGGEVRKTETMAILHQWYKQPNLMYSHRQEKLSTTRIVHEQK